MRREIPMRLVLAFVSFLPFAVRGEGRMLYVEYSYVAPGVEKGSFEGSSNKIWRVGDKYVRLEEAPDPKMGIHQLIIAAEPDSYLINRFTNTGTHFVDPGPDYSAHFPIFPGTQSKNIEDLEFGNELKFFSERKASVLPDIKVGNELCEVQRLKFEDTELTLFTSKKSGRPAQISIKAPDESHSVRYLAYDERPQDLSLFVAPKGVVISEAKPSRGAVGHKPADIDPSEQVFNKWLMNYYLHPEPEKTPEMIAALRSSGSLEKPSAMAPIVAFLSIVFRDNREHLSMWLSTADKFSPAEQRVLIYGLWYSDTDEARNLMRTLSDQGAPKNRVGIAKLLTIKPTKIESLEINSSAVLDMLWGAFFATGDEKYVARIISALRYLNAKGEVNKLLIGGAAKWSLTSNAVQHDRVLAICRSQVAKQPKETREILNQVVEGATKEMVKMRGARRTE